MLFFPLSGVLGHVSRSLALAEEFAARGHEVTVAMRCPRLLRPALPAGIRLVPTRELQGFAPGRFGRIARYEGGRAADRANLARPHPLTAAERRRVARLMHAMAVDDAAIVERLRPDAIITDYRFTRPRLPPRLARSVFTISQVLGYPSLHRRVTGAPPYPLEAGQLLVPGIREIEYWRRRPPRSTARRRETLCGPFRWAGWRRLPGAARPAPPADVLCCFGSTGDGGRVVPQLLRLIPAGTRITCLGARPRSCPAGLRVQRSPPRDLESLLAASRLLICHGGHGTVMEAIRSATPTIVIPHNLEQLEIGRRLHTMRLGCLLARPLSEVSPAEFARLLAEVPDDARLRANLAKYAGLLRRRSPGVRRAAAVVLRRI